MLKTSFYDHCYKYQARGKVDQERINRDAKSREEFDEEQNDFYGFEVSLPTPISFLVEAGQYLA